MKGTMMIALLLGAVAVTAGAGTAFAEMDGPRLPDGPLQGLMRDNNRADDKLGRFDTNHDGRITRQEMNNVLGARFAAVTHHAPFMSEAQFDQMHEGDFQKHNIETFRRLDWNGDGKLSLEEYMAPQRVRFQTMDRDATGVESCAPDSQTAGPSSSRKGGGAGRGGGFGRQRFCNDYDVNRDGKVTRAEFDQVGAKHFAAATNGSGTMNLAQFAADAQAHFDDMNKRMFARLDKDRDGKLTVGEYSSSELKLFARMDRNQDGTIESDEKGSRFRGHRGGDDGPG